MILPLPYAPAPLLDQPHDHELTQLAMGLRRVVKREFATAQRLADMRALGWYVQVVEGTYGVDTESADLRHGDGDFCTAYFGERSAVEKACDLELVERHGRGSKRRDAMVQLGTLLGYPACCTEAYVAQAQQDETASYARLFETGPWVNAPRWNNLFVLSHALISHFPCSLACERSAELAGTTWSRLAATD
ncbi:MAG: DUF483 domain-containing protein, partial [Myxococcota bacterium]|nr:DUF483 domain-containing protein [Myxococcota bacterium]